MTGFNCCGRNTHGKFEKEKKISSDEKSLDGHNCRRMVMQRETQASNQIGLVYRLDYRLK